MIIRLYCGVFVQRAIQERGMRLSTSYTGFHWKELNRRKLYAFVSQLDIRPGPRLYSRIIFHGSPRDFKAPESSQDLYHSS